MLRSSFRSLRRRRLATLHNHHDYDRLNRAVARNELIYKPSKPGPVKKIYISQLGSNHPCEDRILFSALKSSENPDKFAISVIDGHGGVLCADAVASRLHHMMLASCTDVGRGRLSDANMDITDTKDSNENIHCCFPRDRKLSKHLIASRQPHLDDWRNWLSRNPDVEADQPFLMQKAFEFLDTGVCNDSIAAVKSILDSSDSRYRRNAKIGADGHDVHNFIDDESMETREHSGLLLMAEAACSGSCCCSMMIEDGQVSIANTGDCFAVLGQGSEDSSSKKSFTRAVPLTQPHNYWNLNERGRILNEHPNEEYVICSERLLSCLLPFRAFGDINFKLPLGTLSLQYVKWLGTSFILPNYISPPYLTATPETSSHKLSANDNDYFIVIASDGLSDFLTGQTIVNIVQRYLNIHSASKSFEPDLVQEDGNCLTLERLRNSLKKRANAHLTAHGINQQSDSNEWDIACCGVDEWSEENKGRPLPKDESQGMGIGVFQNVYDEPNAATHLIRHALGGGNPDTADMNELDRYLSHPKSRLIRDDMSVVIIQLNQEYLRRDVSI